MDRKRIVSAFLAFAVCFAMAGCDKNDSSKSDERSSTDKKQSVSESASDSDVSGIYVPFEGIRRLGNDPKQLMTNFDSAIDQSQSYFSGGSDGDTDKLDKIAAVSVLELDEDGGFTAYYQPTSSGTDMEFTGSYKTDGGKLSFEYKHEKRTVTSDKFGDKLDTPEVSEADAGSGELLGKNMELMNTVGEGTYLQYAAPMWFAADYLKFDMCVMPMPMGMRSFSQSPIQMDEKVLKEAKRQYFTVHNGVLCADTAGWELDGSYSKGGSFNVKFDPMAAADDWYFYANETPDDIKDMLKASLKTEDMTTIEFSSNKWEWKNAEGDTLNSGSYTESDKIDGLFCMYIDENSSHGTPENNIYQFMYINGSQIYYPYAFKA